MKDNGTTRFKSKTLKRIESIFGIPNFYDAWVVRANPSEPINTAKKKKYAIGLIHKVYLAKLKNCRKYTASTKTKSEVRGGGAKPWKQKGTGQARAGSIRSPLWVGGGVIFGPKPRVVKKKINKKELRRAFFATLYLKREQFILLEDGGDYNTLEEKINGITLTELAFGTKTKDIASFLDTNNLSSNLKVTIILNKASHPKNCALGMSNLRNVNIMYADCLNLPDLLKADRILLSQKSLQVINLTYKFNFSL